MESLVASRRNSAPVTENSVKPQLMQTKSWGKTITVPLSRASSPPDNECKAHSETGSDCRIDKIYRTLLAS